jgi:hypothetical protein
VFVNITNPAQMLTFSKSGAVIQTRNVLTMQYQLSKSDSVRRRRPAPLDIRSGTSHVVELTIIENDQCSDFVGPDGTRYMSCPSEHVSLGDGGEYPLNPIDMSNQVRVSLKGDVVNLAVAMGQYRETADMLTGALQTFCRGVKGLAGRKSPKAWLKQQLKSPSKAAANTYLQWTYGVSPLIQDINDSIKALKLASAIDPVISGKVRKTFKQKFEKTERSALLGNLIPQVAYRGRRELRCKADWLCVLKNTELLSTLGAYGFTNPLSVAWELVPYSFVADWFANTGDFIASLDNLIYVRELWVQPNTSATYERIVPVHSGYGRYFHQYRSRSLPTKISPVVNLQYHPSLSARRLLNAAALTRQLFK